MKILKIRFKNLNSLAGVWEIDLTHPQYIQSGIFAITGPTGAGKSTILDAVCLALYGRTPRLNRVSKSVNEIMSRRTSECFAEVVFETKSGRYRCHWSQRRARDSAEGALQAPKHEIADDLSGNLLETKITGVAEVIENTTGMDFDRFTRSMLLAQGGFAVFLQASPDERAPILEQITGTEIYSIISKTVHELKTEKQRELKILEEAVKGIELLKDEEISDLKTRLQNIDSESARLEDKLKLCRQGVDWLKNISSLKIEISQIENQKNRLLQEIADFAGDKTRLEKSHLAQELTKDYTILNSLRAQQKEDENNLQAYGTKAPVLEKEAQEAANIVQENEDKLQQEKENFEEQKTVFQQVRRLDTQILEKNDPIKSYEDEIAKIKASLKKLDQSKIQKENDLEETQSKLKTIQDYILSNQRDENLIQYLAGIRSRFDSIKSLDKEYKNKTSAHQKAQKESAKAQDRLKNVDERLSFCKTEYENIEIDFKNGKNRLEEILQGKEIKEWQKLQYEYKEKNTLIEKTLEILDVITAQNSELAQIRLNKNQLMEKESSLKFAIDEREAVKTELSQKIQLLEEELIILNRIESLEKHRQHLKDGEPCPLCGALEHPFAQGIIPVPHETKEELDNAKNQIKEIEKELLKLKTEEAKNTQSLEHSKKEDEKISIQLSANQTKFSESLSLLTIDPSEKKPSEVLKSLLQDNQEKARQIQDTIVEAEKAEKEVLACRQRLDKKGDELNRLEKETQTALHNSETACKDETRLKEESENLKERIDKEQEEALQEVRPYGIDSLPVSALDNILKDLTQRRNLWDKNSQQKTDLEKDAGRLQMELKSISQQIEGDEVRLKDRQDHLKTLQAQRDTLQKERSQMFGDKDPDKEEKVLAKRIASAEKELKASEEKKNCLYNSFSQLTAKIEELRKIIEERQKKIKDSEGSFHRLLSQRGFADEAQYAAALLDEKERKQLQKRSDELQGEKTKLETRFSDKTQQLKNEEEKKVTEKTMEELNQEEIQLKKESDSLNQDAGAIKEKLEKNEEQRRKKEGQIKEAEAKRKDYSLWERLHSLIGSADGKKFRNFAQGLTFEMMINHANEQLRKMMNRYLLVRDEDKPLELNVIDEYQGGEVRSTKNLSGGESFIVSLALALGLSKMSSRNVPIDSLFLDEGFGTLDEDSLNTAVETLSELQQDGKLIGLISHVSALKERISAQIQVKPLSGGRSVIKGPGCKQIN